MVLAPVPRAVKFWDNKISSQKKPGPFRGRGSTLRSVKALLNCDVVVQAADQ
jgi:hypothetical protein